MYEGHQIAGQPAPTARQCEGGFGRVLLFGPGVVEDGVDEVVADECRVEALE